MTIHVIANGKTILEDNPQEDEMITLQLSKEAALALKYVLGLVGGCEQTSQRKYTSAICRALPGDVCEDYWQNIEGSMRFLK